jgi:hypothetical protein
MAKETETITTKVNYVQNEAILANCSTTVRGKHTLADLDERYPRTRFSKLQLLQHVLQWAFTALKSAEN